MHSDTKSTVMLGASAGFLATIPQTAIGKLEDELFLPSSENADIAPRLVHRLGRRIGVDVSNPAKWILGTLYHVGYGAGWGVAYALVRERWPHPALLGGTLMGGLIYGITFSRWGMGVWIGAERPPHVRTRRMTFVDLSVAMTFGVATALAYDQLREWNTGTKSERRRA